MTSIRPTIDKAGRFPVIQTPCPYFKGEPADLTAPRAGVLHTTEGGYVGSLAVFKVHYAPQFLLGLDEATKRVEIHQLVPVGVIGAACKGHNKLAVVQVEMIGYAQEKLWQPDPETLDALASLMNVCRDEWGIPLSHPWAVGDYGRAGHNPHRDSGKFGTVAGWFGHADVPDPDTHWDPGNLNWDAVFARAKALQPVSATVAQSPAPQSQTHAPLAENPQLVHGIAWAQLCLNRAGYKPMLAVDGVRGPKTQEALAKFQASKSIFADGMLSDATVKALADLGL